MPWNSPGTIDHMVLFSGDGDFRSLVEAMQRRGVRVTVVSTVSTQPPMVADELRRQADVFLDIVELQGKIGRDPGERTDRPPREPREPRDARPHTPQFLQRGPAPSRAAPIGTLPTTISTRTMSRRLTHVCGRAARAIARAVRGLSAFREAWRAKEPGWFNAPVASFGPIDARLLIVGLAPGLQGANRTGRPFTGDYAGVLLYETLVEFGFARGRIQARPDDGLTLVDARISNAVRCVPPENKPTREEISDLPRLPEATIAEMRASRSVVALGRIAHDSVVRALDGAASWRAPFGHGASHAVGDCGCSIAIIARATTRTPAC